jgi:hypothetical protein
MPETMPLASGTKLGPYEIQSPLGSGGMGEVYRARDTRLERTVAIKILPAHFSSDPVRKQRFEREAKTISNLNHPHICVLHDVGSQDGIDYLVMECVEGETLAKRLEKGPMPLERVLRFGGQIADALDKAHRSGVVHRDLKPGNIMLTSTGAKLLDFGLAKPAMAPASMATLTAAVTQTTPVTQEGTIVGTFQYMSPEQIEGKELDGRSDIFSLGAVLYEMLTGQRAFPGKSQLSVASTILEKEPAPISAAKPMTPPALDHAIRRCLAKEPERRWQSAGDLARELEWVAEGGSQAGAAQPYRKTWWQQWGLAAAGLAVGILLGASLLIVLRPMNHATLMASTPRVQTTIELLPNAPLALGSHVPNIGYDSPTIALSPDGAYVTYLAKTASGVMIHLREMASGEIRPIAGTEGAIYSFFSPDGQWVGFLTSDRVKKIPLRGGAVVTLCEARSPTLAWWLEGDFIYFTEDEAFRITRVSATGGKTDGVLDRTKVAVRSFTDVLPGGKSVLANYRGGIGGDYLDIVLVNAETLETKVLVRSGYGARYVPPGFLLFAREGNVLATPFDADRKEVTGEPVPVAAGVAMESLFCQVHASYSRNGMMAFAPGGDLSVGKLAWVDRNGKVEYLDAPRRVYGVVELAPDGRRLAVQVADVKDYIWIYDFARREGRRLPGSDHNGWPIWSPDGHRIAAVISQTGKQPNVLSIREAEGGRETDPPVNFPDQSSRAHSWSPKENVLAAVNFDTTWHVSFLMVGKTVLTPGFDGNSPSFSPDGRWLAYTSNQKTGVSEVFIRSYPDGKVDRQVSVDGGIEPRWKPSGDLFYRKGGRWFSTRVSTQPELHWDPPRLTFETDFIDTPGTSYDISSDGQRLLVVKRTEPTLQSRINIVVNWPADLIKK